MLNINQLGCKWSITAHHHDATQPGHKNVPPLRWLHLSSIIYTPLCLPGQRGVVEVEGEGGGGAGLAPHLYTYLNIVDIIAISVAPPRSPCRWAGCRGGR